MNLYEIESARISDIKGLHRKFTSVGVENHYDFLVNLWARFPVAFLNTLSSVQVFDFSQVFGLCGPVLSYDLSPAKPPEAEMQTLQLILAVSRPEQRLRSRKEQGKTSPGL